ncbi:uncharacterized protein LOC127252927 [Andrographis paniculata]|uniref:uncharacterized protein LOC127252927 n=1 Tax=Andrographis paniculata TaxID=175694 RepID=UPI0021E88C62|nr:uncharacterized protein LOC127252927 [Andrographis paniculata]
MGDSQLSGNEIILRLLYELCEVKVPFPCDFYPNIPKLDMYEDKGPQELFDQYDDHQEIHFLTTLKVHNCNSSSRQCGKGRWIHQRFVPVYNNRMKTIGMREEFIYSEPKTKKTDSILGKTYLLREYSLDDKYRKCSKKDYKENVFWTVVKKDASDSSCFAEPPLGSWIDVDTYLDALFKLNYYQWGPTPHFIRFVNREN